MSATNTAIEVLNGIIKTHDKYKGAYFWRPPVRAKDRRKNEERFPSTKLLITLDNGDVISVKQEYHESCKNCYYTAKYYLNTQHKDIRLIKKTLKNYTEISTIYCEYLEKCIYDKNKLENYKISA